MHHLSCDPILAEYAESLVLSRRHPFGGAAKARVTPRIEAGIPRFAVLIVAILACLLYTSPSPRDPE